MYVCICNALNERRVRQAIRTHRPTTLNEVYAACGVTPQCGKCAPAIWDILEEECAAVPPVLALAAE